MRQKEMTFLDQLVFKKSKRATQALNENHVSWFCALTLDSLFLVFVKKIIIIK